MKAYGRISRDELRTSILGRLDTFAEHVEWIGGSADIAFADSIIALADYLVTQAEAAIEDESCGPECEVCL